MNFVFSCMHTFWIGHYQDYRSGGKVRAAKTKDLSIFAENYTYDFLQ